jgi:hypothetical protein
MFRFSIKVGLAATAVYYLNKEGVWKESHESLKTYNRLNTTLEPYIKEVQKQIPIELPEIPKNERTSQTVKLYWNKGVLSTFQFLSELPHLLNTWTQNGITAILENPDVKMFLESSPPDESVSTSK